MATMYYPNKPFSVTRRPPKKARRKGAFEPLLQPIRELRSPRRGEPRPYIHASDVTPAVLQPGPLDQTPHKYRHAPEKDTHVDDIVQRYLADAGVSDPHRLRHLPRACACCKERNEQNLRHQADIRRTGAPPPPAVRDDVTELFPDSSRAALYRSLSGELHAETRYLGGTYSPLLLRDSLEHPLTSEAGLVSDVTPRDKANFPPIGETIDEIHDAKVAARRDAVTKPKLDFLHDDLSPPDRPPELAAKYVTASTRYTRNMDKLTRMIERM